MKVWQQSTDNAHVTLIMGQLVIYKRQDGSGLPLGTTECLPCQIKITTNIKTAYLKYEVLSLSNKNSYIVIH
jgi:hypothetical protein